MYVKENVYRLLTFLFIIIVFGGIIFATIFFRAKIQTATNPNQSVISFTDNKFDFTSYEKVIKRLNIK